MMVADAVDVATPHPLGAALPSLYHDDPFAQALTRAFDGVIAPIIAVLDNLEAYLDAGLAPEYMLNWLAVWLGAGDDRADLAERRTLVARAVELYRRRGTRDGLQAQVEILTGGTAEIIENGGVGWSVSPRAPLPGKPTLTLLVKVQMPPGMALDPGARAALDALVAASKPAHLPHTIEVSDG